MADQIITSLSLGLLASASPCVFPLYPGFLAYLSGGQQNLGTKGRYLLGFFVLAGVLSMMLLLGAGIAALSISVGRAISYVIPAADLIIIGLGVFLRGHTQIVGTAHSIKQSSHKKGGGRARLITINNCQLFRLSHIPQPFYPGG